MRPIIGHSHHIATHGKLLFLDDSRMLNQILKYLGSPPRLLMQLTQEK